MKVREFKRFLQDKNDEDVLIFSEYSPYSEAYTREVRVVPRLRSPRKTEFTHEDCKFCETITLKNQKRVYCNQAEDIISKYDTCSCEHFEHKNQEIKYCLECTSCYASYYKGCKQVYSK